jgi:hypothetical protein
MWPVGVASFLSFVADLDDQHAGVLMPVFGMIDGACNVYDLRGVHMTWNYFLLQPVVDS